MFVDLQGPWNWFWGRLPLLLQLHYTNPVIDFTFVLVVLGGIAVVGALTYFKLWG
ncbi:cytochrome o ubiquinol oxidase subunit I [Salinisphaera hydrothermalis C27AD]